MPTQIQIKNLSDKLKKYQRKYLKKQYEKLDESATRIMINSLLTDVLGYAELEDIKTEYMIKGTYADYIVQLNRKDRFIVEVKSIGLDLNENHLRQSLNYAANEGINWIILTNGRQIELHRVIFGKPISHRKVFEFDLTSKEDAKKIPEFLIYLSKKSIERNELEPFWKKVEALEPTQLSKNLYCCEITKLLKKALKKKTGLTFSEEDIIDSIYKIITTKIESSKPKHQTQLFKKKKTFTEK